MDQQFIPRLEMQLLALTNNEQATPKPAGAPRLGRLNQCHQKTRSPSAQ